MKTSTFLVSIVVSLAAVLFCSAEGASRRPETDSLMVVQSTPGDGFVHRSFSVQGTRGDPFVHGPKADSRDGDGTIRVAVPKAWTIRLEGKGTDDLAWSDSVAPTVIWVRTIGDGSKELSYVRFVNGSWSHPSAVPADVSGELGSRWWENSHLIFVYGTPGSADPENTLGTPGVINPHWLQISVDSGDEDDESGIPRHARSIHLYDSIHSIHSPPQGSPGSIDPKVLGKPGDSDLHASKTDSDGDSDGDHEQSQFPTRTRVIVVDSSILVIPSVVNLRDGEPTLSVTHVGDTIVPTVTWAHAVSPGDHDPVMARFLNRAWTPVESIASSVFDERKPRIHQDATQTLHVAWDRAVGASNSFEEILYVNLPEGAGIFSDEERVSRYSESAFNPSIVTLSSGAVSIAYEIERAGMRSVVVARRVARPHDHGFRFRHRLVGRTSGDHPASPELTSIGRDDLLLTWIASPAQIGYRVLAQGRWGSSSTLQSSRTKLKQARGSASSSRFNQQWNEKGRRAGIRPSPAS